MCTKCKCLDSETKASKPQLAPLMYKFHPHTRRYRQLPSPLPVSSLLFVSSPADLQLIQTYEPPRLSHMNTTQLQRPIKTLPIMEPANKFTSCLHISQLCLCKFPALPNCVYDINSKAANTSGSPKNKKKQNKYPGCANIHLHSHPSLLLSSYPVSCVSNYASYNSHLSGSIPSIPYT